MPSDEKELKKWSIEKDNAVSKLKYKNVYSDGRITITNEQVNDSNIVAKEIINLDERYSRYIAKIYGGELYDNLTSDVRYNKKDWKYKTISEDVYNNYVKYIQTGLQRFKLAANRGI